jgi:hypothetical protein
MADFGINSSAQGGVIKEFINAKKDQKQAAQKTDVGKGPQGKKVI